jgi:bifunctional NMN adenylyltransferase/nudix hydrolase
MKHEPVINYKTSQIPLKSKVKPYNTIVYIGRFQPFHNGHYSVLQQARKLAKNVICIIGSANEPRTYKNPFTVNERISMIEGAFYGNNIDWTPHCCGVESSPYNDDAWVTSVQEIVDRHDTPEEGVKIGIIGYNKDETSYYLKMFPQWEFIEAELVEPLDATAIREMYFRDQFNFKWFDGIMPAGAIDQLIKMHNSDDWHQIVAERKFIEKYKLQYASLPYPPTFVTTDAVVFFAGHVLMVKRKAEPGKGLLAFPGGFLNAKTDKSLEAGMLRELKEETGIKVPDKVLRGSIKDVRVFDAIDRSARGRTITHAFHIVLDDIEQPLPKVKGSDDAEKAMWIPISQVKREQCFEDHFAILQFFLGR